MEQKKTKENWPPIVKNEPNNIAPLSVLIYCINNTSADWWISEWKTQNGCFNFHSKSINHPTQFTNSLTVHSHWQTSPSPQVLTDRPASWPNLITNKIHTSVLIRSLFRPAHQPHQNFPYQGICFYHTDDWTYWDGYCFGSKGYFCYFVCFLWFKLCGVLQWFSLISHLIVLPLFISVVYIIIYNCRSSVFHATVTCYRVNFYISKHSSI